MHAHGQIVAESLLLRRTCFCAGCSVLAEVSMTRPPLPMSAPVHVSTPLTGPCKLRERLQRGTVWARNPALPLCTASSLPLRPARLERCARRPCAAAVILSPRACMQRMRGPPAGIETDAAGVRCQSVRRHGRLPPPLGGVLLPWQTSLSAGNRSPRGASVYAGV